jgi:hypothetical protein
MLFDQFMRELKTPLPDAPKIFCFHDDFMLEIGERTNKLLKEARERKTSDRSHMESQHLLKEPLHHGLPFHIGMPFESIWIESLNQKSFYAYDLPEWEPLCHGPVSIYFEGLYVHRMGLYEGDEPYYFLVLYGAVVDMKNKRLLEYIINPIREFITEKNYDRHIFHPFLFELFQSLRQEGKWGHEAFKRKYKQGSGKNKEFIKINGIVHVKSKKSPKDTVVDPEAEKRIIDWSHRWEVMGHWRKVAGIGKDEMGKYGVKGFTWVRPHTKGPQEKELIKKIRLVDSQEGGNDGEKENS